MSEHDSHEDPALSAIYRRISQEEPSAQLDGRVMESARRHVARRSPRWWLPLSTAAVLVLAVTLLLRHQQAPDELQREMAQLGSAVQSTAPATAPTAPREEAPAASAAPAPEMRRKEARDLAKPAPLAKSMVADAPPAEAEKKRELSVAAEQQAEPAEAMKAPEALSAVPAQADEVQAQPAERARSAAAPQAAAGVAPKLEETTEAPDPWLKRIEALRVKGEIETAKRELAAFRKAYPAWPLPKELQALLPESAK